jgi:hypothetical protein
LTAHFFSEKVGAMAIEIIPEPLPKTLTVRFKPLLMRSIYTYVIHSDVSLSRLIQRAVGRELTRLSRIDPKLKVKLERVIKDGTTTIGDYAD